MLGRLTDDAVGLFNSLTLAEFLPNTFGNPFADFAKEFFTAIFPLTMHLWDLLQRY